MFTRADAEQLRNSLEPIDFSAEPEQTAILDRYRSHYGLDFGSSELPVRHVIGTFHSGEFSLVCQHFALPLDRQKGTVFLLHGYFDHAGIYGHIIKHCLQQDLSVVIFDLPGHGLSSGDVAGINSFQQYVEALLNCLELAEQQSVNQPWISIGQSTGGAVLVDALLTTELQSRFPIQQFILLAPLLRSHGWKRTRLLFALARHFLRASKRVFSVNSHDREFLDFLKYSDALQSQLLPRDWVLAMIDYQSRFELAAESGQNLYIIQGSDDTTVDWQYNLSKLQAKFPGSKVYMIAEARHQLVNESADYRARLFSLIDKIVEELG